MQSFIKNSNSYKIPFGLILLFVFIYICPNIRFLSVGENSFFPIFIFLFGYSFFKERELYIYFLYSLTCLIYPIYNSIFETKFEDYAIVSSLMSLYILTIPILSSITLGKIIGSRYFYLPRKKSKKEIKFILIFVGLLFILSALSKTYFPNFLYFFLHAGRASYDRVSFFFTEPSNASIFILLLLTLNIVVFGKNKLSEILYPESQKIGLVIFISTCIVTYLSKPLTLFVQLFFISFIYAVVILTYLLKKAFIKKRIYLSLIGLNKSLNNFLKNFLIVSLLLIIFYFLFFGSFERFSKILNSSSMQQYFINFTQLGGFRFYYSISSLLHGISNPLSIPGDWVEQFKPSMYYLVDLFKDEYSLIIPDPNSTLQLYKTNLLLIKPLGWFYFSFFDLGIIGFFFFTYFMLADNFKFLYKGIKKYDHFIILLFSLQIALIFLPTTTSAPYVFFPISIVSAIREFEKNHFLISKE